jgi:regulator of nucleoside diphosphate kinase
MNIVTEADTRRLRSLTRRLKAGGWTRRDHIAALDRCLSTAKVVHPREIPRNVVTLNSRVRLRDVVSGHRSELTLVDPFDATTTGDRVSVAGPWGTALLGKHVGQIINWKLGSKKRRLRIERVVYQPEAAGHFHL